jgi:predicted lipoprotein with Yx(FWY)xxD motif
MKNKTVKNVVILLLVSGILSGAVNAASEMLAAKNGMTIYTFDKDKANSGKSVCVDDCATTWPPVPVNEASSSATEYGSLVRADGFKQLTLRGQPVYFFAGDSATGQSNGDKLGGVWHVITDVPKVAKQKHSNDSEY